MKRPMDSEDESSCVDTSDFEERYECSREKAKRLKLDKKQKVINKLVRCGKRFDDDSTRYVLATQSGQKKLYLSRLRENIGFRSEVEVKWEKWERFEIEDVGFRFKSKLAYLCEDLVVDEPRIVKGVIYCTIKKYKYRLGDVKE